MLLGKFDPTNHDDQSRLTELQAQLGETGNYRELVLHVARMIPAQYENWEWEVPPPDQALSDATRASALALTIMGHELLALLARVDGTVTVGLIISYMTPRALQEHERIDGFSQNMGYSILCSFLASFIYHQNASDPIVFGKQLLAQTPLPFSVASHVLEAVRLKIAAPEPAVLEEIVAESRTATKH